MDYFLSLFCVIGLSCLVISELEACMCAEEKHLQQHFCESDYVIKARVLSMDPIYDSRYKMKVPRALKYNIKLLKSFKIGMPSSQVPVQETSVYTSATSCGVPYSLGKIYLIAGMIKTGEQWSSECTYSREWKQVTHHQRKFMKFGRYAKHCECLPKMTKLRSRDYCSTTDMYWDCYARYSYCEVATYKNRCKWQANKPLTACLHEREP